MTVRGNISFHLTKIFLSCIVFIAIFAGDYTLIGASISLFASIFLLIITLGNLRPIRIKYHIWYIFTFSLIVIDLINGILYSQTEAIIRVQILFAALIMFLLIQHIFPDRMILLWLKVIAISLLLGALISTSGTNERGFIFGPNILYRAVIFPFFNSGILIATLITMGISIATLSRGAFLVGGMLSFWQISAQWRVILASTSLIIGFLLLTLIEFELPRFAVFYDISGSNSISDRLRVIVSIPDHLSIFGHSHESFNQHFPFIKYPHNTLIELIYFYGLVGVLISVYLLYNLICAFLGKRSPIMIVCFIPTFISGNLVDNFLFLTLAVAYDSKK